MEMLQLHLHSTAILPPFPDFEKLLSNTNIFLQKRRIFGRFRKI